jgi:hypothetical protein
MKHCRVFLTHFQSFVNVRLTPTPTSREMLLLAGIHLSENQRSRAAVTAKQASEFVEWIESEVVYWRQLDAPTETLIP